LVNRAAFDRLEKPIVAITSSTESSIGNVRPIGRLQNKLSSGYKGLGPPQLAASPGGQRGHDNTSYNTHRCADSFRWRLVRQGSLVLGLVSAAAHTAGSDILGGSQRAAPAGVRPDCNVLDRAPRVRANISSKAIFVTAMWAASIASISSFGRTPSTTARAA
jgi:hypothetical protein